MQGQWSALDDLGLPPAAAFPPDRDGDLNPELVCLFIAWQVRRGLANDTISRSVTALADWQRGRGAAEADRASRHPAVQSALAQALRRRALAPPGAALSRKAPFPLDLLVVLLGWLRHLANADPGRRREREQDAAWLTAGFLGMLRRSELAALRVGDVTAAPGGGVRLFIARSKTDQTARGAEVFLAERTASGIPTARILLRHVERRRTEGAGTGAHLFGAAGAAAAWHKGAFTRRLRSLLSAAGAAVPALGLAPERYSAHSLRHGGATAAAEAGATLGEIMEHGRWRSLAVRRYVHLSAATRMRLTARV